MLAALFGAFAIMCMRICDVTVGTFRIILVNQGKKYFAAAAGFIEVLIWIFAMRYIVQHMDQTINLFGYAVGFSIGNILGISLEEKVALGFVQLNIISKFATDKIADTLRLSQFGVTIIPGEGGRGGVAILLIIIRRKDFKKVMSIIESIDNEAFVTVHHSRPYRGFIHGARK